MRRYVFDTFGCQNLKLTEAATPEPGPGEVRVDVQAISLNYRDVLVTEGHYNPKMRLPATPISDGAGVISAVGEGVERVRMGDRVMSHFVAGWLDGPFRGEYGRTTLGTPGPGLAAEQVVLPADAVLPIPPQYAVEEAATLPIAALTAWSVLKTIADLQPGQTVLTLGTGGVSVFAVQLAQALGARVIVTSSRDEKLRRAEELGADHGINYANHPDWEARVLEYTGGAGVDVVVETVGARTLNQSLKAAHPGGVIGLLGALHGMQAEINAGLILMKRLRVEGVLVDSRRAFENLVAFLDEHDVRPVIDQRYPFDRLGEAFWCMQQGRHFGKIVVTL